MAEGARLEEKQTQPQEEVVVVHSLVETYVPRDELLLLPRRRQRRYLLQEVDNVS